MEVRIAGRIFNGVTNTPINNKKVTTKVYKRAPCGLCFSRELGSGKSGTDGKFSFSVMIDSSLFNESYIAASMEVPDNYLFYPTAVGPTILKNKEYLNSSFYELDQAGMENIAFEMYPKVLLTIKLRRTTPISPQKHLSLEFNFSNKTLGWGLLESNSNADTSLTIYTASGFYTKVISRKWDSANNLISKTDSILCASNRNNTISIDY